MPILTDRTKGYGILCRPTIAYTNPVTFGLAAEHEFAIRQVLEYSCCLNDGFGKVANGGSWPVPEMWNVAIKLSLDNWAWISTGGFEELMVAAVSGQKQTWRHHEFGSRHQQLTGPKPFGRRSSPDNLVSMRPYSPCRSILPIPHR